MPLSALISWVTFQRQQLEGGIKGRPTKRGIACCHGPGIGKAGSASGGLPLSAAIRVRCAAHRLTSACYPGIDFDEAGGYLTSLMWGKLRHIAVVLVVALGLIVPGVAMASVGPSSCQAAHAGCMSGGSHHHAKQSGSPCQAICPPIAALPTPASITRPVLWTAREFTVSAAGIPLGRDVTPDPLPPRPLSPI